MTFTGDSAESWLERDERILGPSIMAKAALEPQGRYDELRDELLALYREREHRPATAASAPTPSTC